MDASGECLDSWEVSVNLLIDDLCELRVPGQILHSRILACGSWTNDKSTLPCTKAAAKQIVLGSVSISFPSLAKKHSGLNSDAIIRARIQPIETRYSCRFLKIPVGVHSLFRYLRRPRYKIEWYQENRAIRPPCIAYHSLVFRWTEPTPCFEIRQSYVWFRGGAHNVFLGEWLFQ